MLRHIDRCKDNDGLPFEYGPTSMAEKIKIVGEQTHNEIARELKIAVHPTFCSEMMPAEGGVSRTEFLIQKWEGMIESEEEVLRSKHLMPPEEHMTDNTDDSDGEHNEDIKGSTGSISHEAGKIGRKTSSSKAVKSLRLKLHDIKV